MNDKQIIETLETELNEAITALDTVLPLLSVSDKEHMMFISSKSTLRSVVERLHDLKVMENPAVSKEENPLKNRFSDIY